MKRTSLTLFLAYVVLTVIFAAALNAVFAQSAKDAALEKYPFAIENLKEGITSDNDGLRKSSIYFAGYYKITEAANTLISQLSVEKNRGLKILIALSLFEMKSDEGMEYIESRLGNERDGKVRNIHTAIVKEYQAMERGEFAAAEM
jgi:hypothetical protein